MLAFSWDFFNFQVPGLFDFFSPGTTVTTGPSRSLGPVLSSSETKDLLLIVLDFWTGLLRKFSGAPDTPVLISDKTPRI